uniref:Uncharacterized protein n=1 Tax=Anguilla anguilla TaxID=7936 RepID=A0A0E9WKU6_ANGAN
MHLSHEPLHPLRIHGIRPVPSRLEMGANDHRACIEVALQIAVGYSGANEDGDLY